MSVDLSGYMEVFADEAREHLLALNQALLEFEKAPGNLDHVNVMFRSAHTLKSMSAAMGFNEVAELTHNMEDLLASVRQGDLAAGQELIDVLFKCLDSLQEMVEANIEGATCGVDISALVEAIKALAAGGGTQAAAPVETPGGAATGFPGVIGSKDRQAIASAMNSGMKIYHVRAVFSSECLLRNARAFTVIKELRQIGRLIQAVPAERNLAQAAVDDAVDLLFATDKPPSGIEKAVLSVSEIDRVSISEYGAPPAGEIADGTAAVDVTQLFQMNEYEITVTNYARSDGYSVVYAQVTLVEDCPLKSARAYLVYKQLEALGEIISIAPDVQDIEFERFDRDLQFLLVTKSGEAAVNRALNSVSELSRFEVAVIPESPVAAGRKKSQPAEPAPAISRAKAPGQAARAKERPAKKARVAHTVRVETERLDLLLNLVGELVIGKTRLQQLATEIRHTGLTDMIEQIGHIVFDLQNTVMQTRMVPIDTVFNRFPRMIRDLAKTRNKQVELVIVGGETELDRTVVDEIGGPLVHLIRNSLDHGIETREARLSAGKPETGTLTLSARYEGGHVIIEIEDDGAGIDVGEVRRVSVEKGIITREQADALSHEQSLELIFAAGLSTAGKVTDISGRGVGMDAVKSKLDSLNGTVHVSSQFGAGSTVTIRLPLTLAIVQALLFSIGGEIFAAPRAYVEDTLRIRREDVKEVDGQEVCDLKGETLPLVWIRDLLDCPGDESEDGAWFVLVVRSGKRRTGLVVDKLVGQMEIVIKSLGRYLEDTDYISGGTILGDGTVALILDVARIVG